MEMGEKQAYNTSRLEASIQMLEGQIPRAPAGWRRLLRRLIVQLRAVAGPTRSNSFILGGLSEEGQKVGFLVSEPEDRVLVGILRKTEAASKNTCSNCARPGKTHEVGGEPLILCPRCYAPHLLRQQLALWIEKDLTHKHESIVMRSDLPPVIEPIVRADRWRTFKPGLSAPPVEYITPGDLQELRADFDKVYAHVSALI